MQANQPASLKKGLHRIVGTVSGAVAALIFFPPIAYDHVATMLLLFCAGSLAIAGSLVSRYSYAWLLGGITAVMVVLGALDDPTYAGPEHRVLPLRRDCHRYIGRHGDQQIISPTRSDNATDCAWMGQLVRGSELRAPPRL